MSGNSASYPPGNAPLKLLPPIGDFPFGEVRNGNQVFLTAGAFQMLQRFYSYLGQPPTSGSGSGQTLSQGVSSAMSAATAPKGWADIPAEAQQVPLAFIIPASPPPAQIYNLSVPIDLTIPANFAGTTAYFGTPSTASVQFFLGHIVGGGGSPFPVGSFLVPPGTTNSIIATSQPALDVSAGDALQLVAPTPQDATLADICITLLAYKV